MTIFELVKIALDEPYKQGLRHHGERLDEQIKERMRYFTASSPIQSERLSITRN